MFSKTYDKLRKLIVELNVVRVVRIDAAKLFDLNHFLLGDFRFAHLRVRTHPSDARVQLA